MSILSLQLLERLKIITLSTTSLLVFANTLSHWIVDVAFLLLITIIKLRYQTHMLLRSISCISMFVELMIISHYNCEPVFVGYDSKNVGNISKLLQVDSLCTTRLLQLMNTCCFQLYNVIGS